MFEDLKRDILRRQTVDEDSLILEACGKKTVRELMIDEDIDSVEDDPDIERLIDAIPEDTSEEGCVREACTKEGCAKEGCAREACSKEGCAKEGCGKKRRCDDYDDWDDDDDECDDWEDADIEEACKEGYNLISEQSLIESLIDELPESFIL